MIDAGFRVELLEVWDRGEEDTHTLIGLVVEVLGGQGAAMRGYALFFPLLGLYGSFSLCPHSSPSV